MAVTIEMRDGTQATVRNRRWTCEVEQYERMLNTMTNAIGPLGYTPDPDATIAHKLAERFRADVVDTEEAPVLLAAAAG